MKITAEDYEAMKQAIDRTLLEYPHVADEYRKAGLSDMRLNWDLLRASKFDTCRLYSYLNDSHIGTALASIVGNTGKDSKGKR